MSERETISEEEFDRRFEALWTASNAAAGRRELARVRCLFCGGPVDRPHCDAETPPRYEWGTW